MGLLIEVVLMFVSYLAGIFTGRVVQWTLSVTPLISVEKEKFEISLTREKDII